jgi:hypothetical protein
MSLSSDAEATHLESGLQAIIEIPAKCPSKVCSCSPVAAFHILIVLSPAVVTSVSQVLLKTDFREQTHNNSQFWFHLERISLQRLLSCARSMYMQAHISTELAVGHEPVQNVP